MQQFQNDSLNRNNKDKCIICSISQGKQMELAIILKELLNQLFLILQNKEQISQKINNQNAFCDLLKCVFCSKESFNEVSIECNHIAVLDYVCLKYNCNQRQVIKAAQIKSTIIAKRMYELQLVKNMLKNSVHTIQSVLESTIQSKEKRQTQKNFKQQKNQNKSEQKQMSKSQNQSQPRVKLQEIIRQNASQGLNSFNNNLQSNFKNSNFCFYPNSMPFFFGNHYQRFY